MEGRDSRKDTKPEVTVSTFRERRTLTVPKIYLVTVEALNYNRTASARPYVILQLSEENY